MEDAPVNPNPTQIQPWEAFSDYVLNTYISSDAEFPPEIWATEPINQHTTKNGAESFHRDYNVSFGKGRSKDVTE